MKTISFKPLPKVADSADAWVTDRLVADGGLALPAPMTTAGERFTIDVPLDLPTLARQNLDAFGRCGAVLVRAAREISWECLGLAQDRLQKNLDGLASLARCRTAPEFATVQSELVRDSLRELFEDSRRLAAMSVRAADEAAEAVAPRGQSFAWRRAA